MTANTQPRARLNLPVRGVAYALASMMIFGVQDTLIKWLTADYPLMQVVFMRSLLALVPVSLFVYFSGGPRILRTRRPKTHFLRVSLGFIAMLSYYYALSKMPFADTVAIGFSGPLFMTALSAPILAERVGIRRWIAVLVGFGGVVVMVQPGPGMLQSVSLLVVLSSLFYAFSMIISRHLSTTEASATMVFYSNLFHLTMASLCMATRWRTPPLGDLALMASVGLIAAFSQFALMQAYRNAPVFVVSPIDYTQLIWATLLGYLVFGDLPGANIAFGSAIVIGSGLYILFRETRLKRAAVNRAEPRG